MSGRSVILPFIGFSKCLCNNDKFLICRMVYFLSVSLKTVVLNCLLILKSNCTVKFTQLY